MIIGIVAVGIMESWITGTLIPKRVAVLNSKTCYSRTAPERPVQAFVRAGKVGSQEIFGVEEIFMTCLNCGFYF